MFHLEATVATMCCDHIQKHGDNIILCQFKAGWIFLDPGASNSVIRVGGSGVGGASDHINYLSFIHVVKGNTSLCGMDRRDCYNIIC